MKITITDSRGITTTFESDQVKKEYKFNEIIFKSHDWSISNKIEEHEKWRERNVYDTTTPKRE